MTEDDMVGCNCQLNGHWACSGRWWRTGKPGVLWSMGLQTVGHEWKTKQRQQQQSYDPDFILSCLSKRNERICPHKDSYVKVHCRGICQFSSIIQLCPTLRNLKDCSTPDYPVHHQLPELAQTHVHWISDAIQLSHPLSSPSSTFNLAKHQALFQWVSSSHQMIWCPSIRVFFFFEVLLYLFLNMNFFLIFLFFKFYFIFKLYIIVLVSASVLPMNTQDWFLLRLTGLISLQSKGFSRVFSNTTVQKHQFFGAQLSL